MEGTRKDALTTVFELQTIINIMPIGYRGKRGKDIYECAAAVYIADDIT